MDAVATNTVKSQKRRHGASIICFWGPKKNLIFYLGIIFDPVLGIRTVEIIVSYTDLFYPYKTFKMVGSYCVPVFFTGIFACTFKFILVPRRDKSMEKGKNIIFNEKYGFIRGGYEL